MDRATKIDKRLKSRLLMSIIKIEEPTDPELKRITFASKCITDSVRFHPEVTNDWLATLLTNAPIITGRNFRCLAIELHKRLTQNSFNCTWIGKKDLQKTLVHYLEAQKDIHQVDPYEAHVDRLERLHQEQLAHRQQQHEERMRQVEQNFLLQMHLLALNQ